jgi:hypothetical protein
VKLHTEFVATMLERAKEWDCCITYDYIRPCRLMPCCGPASHPVAYRSRHSSVREDDGRKKERKREKKKEEMDGKRDSDCTVPIL